MEAQPLVQQLHGGDVVPVASLLGCTADEILDYSANINPRGLPAAARAILAEAASHPERLLRYPDWTSHPLRRKLAQQLNISPENIVLGAGASALIADIVRAIQACKCIGLLPAFAEYRRACEACGTSFHELRLKAEDDFRVDIDQLLKSVRELCPELLILNNPHNPSGTLIPASTIHSLAALLANAGTTLVVDEAFIDYTPQQQITSAAAATPGLISIRSLTKFFGCPGLRIGYAVMQASLAKRVQAQMAAWTIGSIPLDTLESAIHDEEYTQATLLQNAHQRRWLVSALAALGFYTHNPTANFILLRLPPEWPDSARVREHLLRESRILVRDCASFEGLDDGRYIRVAVLEESQNKRLIKAFSKLKKSLT